MSPELSAALNRYLANLAVAYVKLHNLHWNVVGPNFNGVHAYLETLYDTMAEALDQVAELLKIHGQQPLASLKDYLAAATLPELDSLERPAGQALAQAQADLEHLTAQGEDLRLAAGREDLYDITAALEEQLAGYGKTLWFLRAMGK